MKLILLNRVFRFSWLGLALYALLMALLCSLGFWQLDRAEQKRILLAQQQQALDADRIDLNQQAVTDLNAVRYHKAVLRGRYDAAHQFLLDNQIVDGKSGYFVLTPVFIEGANTAVLINRGWIPMGRDRSSLPDVSFEPKNGQITGRINHFPGVGLKLKGAEIPTDGWPAVVQVVDPRELSGKLGYPVAAYQVELDAEMDDGYKRVWKTDVPIPPEKHLAYAVQWFGLALTLTALFIWMSTRKRSEQSA